MAVLQLLQKQIKLRLVLFYSLVLSPEKQAVPRTKGQRSGTFLYLEFSTGSFRRKTEMINQKRNNGYESELEVLIFVRKVLLFFFSHNATSPQQAEVKRNRMCLPSLHFVDISIASLHMSLYLFFSACASNAMLSQNLYSRFVKTHSDKAKS